MMTHNIITLQAAKKLEGKLISSEVPLGVFCQNGSWQATKTNTKNYESLNKSPDWTWMGDYTAKAPVSWIADDFEAAGIR